MKRRETATERDERIVSEAGPWTVVDGDDGVPYLIPYELSMLDDLIDVDEDQARRATKALIALVNITWRIARARRGR